MALIQLFPSLKINDDILNTARQLHNYLGLPEFAGPDVLHLAIACYWKMDYLLTWNMKHIANAQIRHRLMRYHDETHAPIPTICTPEELLD